MGTLSRLQPLVIAFLVAGPLVAGCARTVSDALDDTTITTRVKTAILNDPVVGGLGIDVNTTQGVVTLSGRVGSQAEREQAVGLARGVSGVSDVTDTLQIAPAGPSAPAR